MEAPFTLPAFPQGWYSLGVTADLPPGAVVARRVAGHELVLFRTASGALSAHDAYCPHMGAHLGHGGTVAGETIRCQFHGFCFDRRGACTATGYGTRPPPKAKLPAWPVREVNGLAMVFYDPARREPTWEIPALDWQGWSPLRSATLPLRSHVQELAENSVDVGHFAVVHGYRGVHVLRDAAVHGPVLTVKYGMHRPGGFLGSWGGGIDVELDIAVHGLGYSMVETLVAAQGVRTRQLVLATPTDEGRVELQIAMSMKRLAPAEGGNRWLALMPALAFDEVVSRVAFQEYVRDVTQDAPIWNHKRYVHPPALAEGDGPIGKYRRWARQFYPEADALRAAG